MTAMALPLFFAACANDELDVVSNNAELQDGRATVEGVVLNLGEGVESRLAYNPTNKKYVWDETDQVGACLMDEITANYGVHWNDGTRWAESFQWVDYIQTNYLFNRDASGNWTTEAKMLEGNYFLHAPYQAQLGARTAYSFACGEQTLENTTTDALLKAYAKNNSFVGYARVQLGEKEGEKLAGIEMVPVFGATGITLENVGTKDYKISKIVLRGPKVNTYAKVDPTGVNNTNKNGEAGTYEYYADNIHMGGFNVANFVGNRYWNGWNNDGYFSTTEALKEVVVYGKNGDDDRVEVNIAAGNALNSKKTLNIIAMVAPTDPTVNLAANDVYLDIHTDKGLIRNIKLGQKNNPENNGLQGNSTTTVNLVTDKALTALAAGDKVLVSFDNTALDIPSTMDIYGSDELAAFIHWNAGTSTNLTANLKTNVTISKAMAEELIKSDITSINLNGEYQVTIASDAPAAALDAFTYTDVTVVNYGTQTLATTKSVPVYNYGTLNVTGNNAYVQITNEGTLNVNTNMSTAVEYNTDESVKTQTSIVNTVNGVMNVAAGKTLTTAVSVVNRNSGSSYKATINNQGTIRYLENAKIVNNTGVIGTTNQVDYLAAEPSVNTGTINNNVKGEVYLSTNSGNIYANDLSTTRVYTNNKNIIITKLQKNGNFLAETMGDIVQEITEVSTTDNVDVRANMIWLSSTLKVEKKDANGNYVLTSLNTAGKNGNVRIEAVGADARIEGHGQTFCIGNIIVRADATLVLSDVNAEIYNTDSTNGYVFMQGYASNHVAKITINNDASLKAPNKTVVAAYAEVDYFDYNIVDNNSMASGKIEKKISAYKVNGGI